MIAVGAALTLNISTCESRGKGPRFASGVTARQRMDRLDHAGTRSAALRRLHEIWPYRRAGPYTSIPLSATTASRSSNLRPVASWYSLQIVGGSATRIATGSEPLVVKGTERAGRDRGESFGRQTARGRPGARDLLDAPRLSLTRRMVRRRMRPPSPEQRWLRAHLTTHARSCGERARGHPQRDQVDARRRATP